MDKSIKYLLLATITCRYAFNNNPGKPQVQLYADTEYKVPEEVPYEIAETAVNLDQAELDERDDAEEAPEAKEFDVDTATKDELKAFIRSYPELDEHLNLNSNKDTLVEGIKSYFSAIADYEAAVESESEAE